MKEIQLSLSITEANMVIKALGQFPYNQVNELIAKIHSQATQQIHHENGNHEKERSGSEMNVN